jgi:signal peptidase I
MPKAASLDRRVRKELTALVAGAKTALAGKNQHASAAGKVQELTSALEQGQAALGSNDSAKMRAALPSLDALVDQFSTTSSKSIGFEYIESIAVAVLIALLLRQFVVEAFKIPSSSMYPTLEIGDHIFVNKLVYGVRVPFSSKKLFTTRSPRRGEVAVFIQPCADNKDYIKRIVAVAGDTVEVRCNVLFINGHQVPRNSTPVTEIYEDLQNGVWSNRVVERFHEQLGGFEYDIYQNVNQMPSGTDFPLLTAFQPPSCGGEGVGPDSAPQAAGKIVVTDAHAATCSQQSHYVVPPGHVFAMGDNRHNSLDSRFWGPVPIENMKGKAMFIWLSFRDWKWSPSDLRPSRMGTFVH